MRAFLIVLLLVGIGAIGAGVATYNGVFYVTGSQYYNGCWERRAKEDKNAKADNPSQPALWAGCTYIMLGSMDDAGFIIASSADEADADAKALASVCPDAYKDFPPSPEDWYRVAVDAIEKTGGPTLIDRVAPAGWLIERAMKARWPRCIDAANKVRKGMSPVTQR
jgi:hypothetical protein